LCINENDIFLFVYAQELEIFMRFIYCSSFFTSFVFSFCQKQQFNSETGLSSNVVPCFVSCQSAVSLNYSKNLLLY